MARFARNDIPADSQREPLAVLTASLVNEAGLHARGVSAARDRLVELVGAWPHDDGDGPADDLHSEQSSASAAATGGSDAEGPPTAGPGALIVAATPGVPIDPLVSSLIEAGAVLIGPPDPLEVTLSSWSFELDWHLPTYAEWLHDADLSVAYRLAARWMATMPRPSASVPMLVGTGHMERLHEIDASMTDATVVIVGGDEDHLDRATDLIARRRASFADEVDRTKLRRYLDFRLATMAQRAADPPDGLRVARIGASDVVSDPRRVAATVIDGGRT